MNGPPSSVPPAAAGPPPEPLAPGSLFAERYEIVRRLGTGGMGTVYLARHREMGRLCAIKLLHPRLLRDAEARERFAREARLVSRVTHPAVCAVYDFGTAEGQVFLAMEYVEGRSLGALLAERGRLPLRRAAALAEEIAAGLDAAHDLGLVHRDLKPDNVIVTVGRGREVVKLVDFGIAKGAAADPAADLTAEGIVVGTPDYMAPEQVAGDPVDRRADLYALALVFCRMATGTLPFRAPTAREAMTRRLTEPAGSLAAMAPDLAVPRGVEEALERALSRAPDERQASAGAFASELTEAVAHLPEDPAADAATVRLDAPTTPEPRATGGRRGRPALIGAGILAVAVAAWGLWLGRPAIQPEAGPAPVDSVAATADTGSASGPGPAGPAVPPPRSAGTPLPALPTPEETTDPATRDAARARAEQIYARPDADPLVRAQAAFLAATVYNVVGRREEAASWAERAVATLALLPDTPEHADRRERYRRFLNQLRPAPPEPPAP